MAKKRKHRETRFHPCHENPSTGAAGLRPENTAQYEAVPEEQSNNSEMEITPSLSATSMDNSNCDEDSTEPQFPPVQLEKPREEYYGDSQLSWRPPVPIEDGIWVPILVNTNGEGKKRIIYTDPLVEVFEVRVDLHGRKYGNIHGKILMDCTTYRTCLFNCDQENALTINEKVSLPLYGTDIAPLGYDPVCFIINLNIDDDELCKGFINWNPCYAPCNEWLYKEVKGKNGSVHMTYAVLKDAWLTDIEMKLIKSAEEEAYSKIHGDIIVYINDMPYLRYFVFSKRSGNCSTIKSLESIPLSRSLFNCPYGSSLVVKIDLWKSDTNEPFVRGALLFPPEYYGDSVGILGSENVIQVKVNWLNYKEHLSTIKAIQGERPWIDLYYS